MSKKNIPTLGVASSIGSVTNNSSLAPAKLQSSDYSSLLLNANLDWQPLLEVSNDYKNSLNMLNKQSCIISQFVQQSFDDKEAFLILGGDHSISIGSWAGIMNQIPAESSFALIWMGANMNAHTIESSPTGNFQGMPVSVLLGEAEHELQSCFPSQQHINGRDLYMFGVSDYSPDEVVLLSKKKVNVFDVERIEHDGGTYKVLHQLIETIMRCYEHFAISIDLNSMLARGDNTDELLAVFNGLGFGENFSGLEVVEIDVTENNQGRSEQLIYEIINSIYK